MKADGTETRRVHDLGGQDDRRERHDVEFCIETSVLVHQLGDRAALAAEAFIVEELPSSLTGQRGQRVQPFSFRRSVDTDDLVPGVGEALADLAAEARPPEDRDAKAHGS